jgi:DNA-binding transcriptional LysR family regulator
LVLVCAPRHPLASRKEIQIEEIAKEKIIGFEPDIPTRKAIDKIFKDIGMEIQPVMEFDNIETVKRAVEIEAGISIVPRATIEQEVKNGTLISIEFKGQPYYRPLGIIYKSARVLSPAMKRFVKLLHEPLQEPAE